MADQLNGIFISELLVDNAGGSAIDTDGDGNTNKADEFIELQNMTGTDVSLDGYEIWSEQYGLLYSFGSGDTIAANSTATVVGNYTGTPPAGYFSAGVSESTNWLRDGEGLKFDSIFLVDTNTGDYIVLSYGDPPRPPTLPTGFPGTTQIGSGESIDSNAPNGTAFARDTNGVLIETTPTPGTPDIPCFLEGTHILTQDGLLPIQTLEPGAQILTKDHGLVTLRGIGCFSPTRREMVQFPELRPICFPKDSLGNLQNLYLSRSHRILLRSTIAEQLFGQVEMLASAHHLPMQSGSGNETRSTPITYYHLLFDEHEIICAEGIWLESLHLADIGMRALAHPEHWTFQKGVDLSGIQHRSTARMVLKQYEVELLFALQSQTVQGSDIAA